MADRKRIPSAMMFSRHNTGSTGTSLSCQHRASEKLLMFPETLFNPITPRRVSFFSRNEIPIGALGPNRLMLVLIHCRETVNPHTEHTATFLHMRVLRIEYQGTFVLDNGFAKNQFFRLSQ